MLERPAGPEILLDDHRLNARLGSRFSEGFRFHRRLFVCKCVHEVTLQLLFGQLAASILLRAESPVRAPRGSCDPAPINPVERGGRRSPAGEIAPYPEKFFRRIVEAYVDVARPHAKFVGKVRGARLAEAVVKSIKPSLGRRFESGLLIAKRT